MTVTAASFQVDYPEFANPSTGISAPQLTAQINYWLTVAGLLLNQNRWGVPAATATNPPTAMIDVATELFVAHNVTIEQRAIAEATKGAPPGVATGPVNSKSVGPVSIGYDTQASIEMDAGHWNLTIYGQRFIKLARMFGAGPIHVGPCGIAPIMSLVPMGPPWWGPTGILP